MIDEAAALRLVYDAIDAINQQLPSTRRLAKAPDTVIVGAGGSLDSLAIVNFVIALEDRVAEATGTPMPLLDADLSIEDSPFNTVAALARHVAARALSRA